jgi:hypothetical protein
LSAGTQARADRRALFSAAVLGSSFGLALSVAYLFTGLAPLAHDHFQAVRLARATGGELTDSMLHRSMTSAGVKSSGAFLLARAHEAPVAGEVFTLGAQAWPGQFGGRFPTVRRNSLAEAQRQLDCLTEAVYFEARSESNRGQAAVAQVVLNRLANPNFPKTVCGVVFQGAARPGCQFTFACDGSMGQPLELAAWDRARKVAQQVLAGVRVAAVGNATHYHTVDVQPYWDASMLRVAQVGLHIFYRASPRALAEREAAVERALFTSAPASPVANLKLASAVVAKSAEAVVAAAPPPKPEPVASPIARAADAAAVPAAETASGGHVAAASEPAAF